MKGKPIVLTGFGQVDVLWLYFGSGFAVDMLTLGSLLSSASDQLNKSGDP